jgi:group II intron reverse transcriptase/maturase
MSNEGIEGDEWATYVMLGRVSETYRGIPYSGRPPRERSAQSSRGDNVPPGSLGKPGTGRWGTGDVILSKSEVCEMQSAETVLGILRERGKRRLPLNHLYRQLFNPQLFLLAYGRLYSNDGAMTPGVTGETVDGMSLEKIERIIDALRHERFRWTPVKRVYIPKKSGKLRPLGLPTWSNKLVQEVVRLLLEAYYDVQFSGHSHGFRSNRGCHTALSEVVHVWKGTHWSLEGDISQCFERLNHETLLAIVGENIHDNRFLRLLRAMLKAGYLEEWRWNATLSGSPQGGVCSPILSNIYLDRLDQFVERELLPRYNQGKLRRRNPAYQEIEMAIRRAKRRGDRTVMHTLRQQRRTLPSQDPNDPNFRRLRYLRYADDFLLGFSGPKAEAEDIKRQIAVFLHDDLKLELSDEKTLITHAHTDVAHFLGYELVVQHADDKLDYRGQRQVNGVIGLRVPRTVISKKCAYYMRFGKPAQRAQMLDDSDYSIVSQYQSEYRGLIQYYLLAQDVSRLVKLRWVMETSMLKTLAGKHRSTVQEVARKYKATTETAYGPRTCFRVVVSRGEDKKPLVAQFGGIPLKRQQAAILVDRLPNTSTIRQNELVKRLLVGSCELCGSPGPVQVHHIRKLANLRQPGRKEKPEWMKLMAMRRRKTLIVCRPCHEAIHTGQSIASFRR